MTYEVWRSDWADYEDRTRVKSGPKPTLREALEAVALPEWGPEDVDEARQQVLTKGYVTKSGPWGAHFSVVREPQEFEPFRVRVELTEPREYTRTYEVAAWYTTIRCEPQVVESAGRTSGYGGKLSQSVELTGTVVDQDLTSLWGGVRMGSRNQPDVGKTAEHSLYWGESWLMTRFTGGGAHEPRPFEVEGMTLHWVGEDTTPSDEN